MSEQTLNNQIVCATSIFFLCNQQVIKMVAMLLEGKKKILHQGKQGFLYLITH